MNWRTFLLSLVVLAVVLPGVSRLPFWAVVQPQARALRPAAIGCSPVMARGLPGIGPVRSAAAAATIRHAATLPVADRSAALQDLPVTAREAALAWLDWPSSPK